MRATAGVAELVRDGVRKSALHRLRRTGVAQLVELQALAGAASAAERRG